MDCSVLGFPVLHYLLEFAQTHIVTERLNQGSEVSVAERRGSSVMGQNIQETPTAPNETNPVINKRDKSFCLHDSTILLVENSYQHDFRSV